jgi:hypothetical protein
MITSQKIKWAGTLEKIKPITRLAHKSDRKRPTERVRKRWEDNIKMNLIETGIADKN